jgi:ammonia channel protein AmtB
MAMCSIGLIAFAFVTASTSIIFFIGVLIWVGLGFALFSSPNMNTIMSSVDKTHLGLASGTAATMRVVGQITSMTIATLFFAGMFSNQTIELVSDSLFMKAVKWGFLSFAIISLAGIYFSYNRGNKPSP